MDYSQVVKIDDYESYPFSIPKIWLDFSIYSQEVHLTCVLDVVSLDHKKNILMLKGENIALKQIKLNEKILAEGEYELKKDELFIDSQCKSRFQIKIKSVVDPFSNKSLEGLYESKGILVTQCEAEGFRRICFHPDRPDVLSKYIVRIEADKDKYPVLLSNGNQIHDELLPGKSNRKEVVWDDPYPKPSYLFALVAGDLKEVRSTYKTISNKSILIRLHVENGEEDNCLHAINSLKKAMKWDESKYQLEYDLDEYNIVAVRHFNMGAMENKGLNIFNSKLVLANLENATDDELMNIESVIAHEYFHNWTGNRVTCRDWFQLSLKEGLTVLRDQCFSADLHSKAVKRIKDVSVLRNIQFVEDSGPTAHAVKPNEYIAIDNFYTTTIYEKGAEVIRMLMSLLGDRIFIKGVKLFINRFDGKAATTEDFIDSIFHIISQYNIDIGFEKSQFIRWYYQPGTPLVKVKKEWKREKNQLKIYFEQSIYSSLNSNCSEMVIPIRMALVGEKGLIGNEELFILKDIKQSYTFENVDEKNCPSISLFRDFTSPVKWEYKYSNNELLHLFEYDNESFSRWEASQEILRRIIIKKSTGNSETELEQQIFKIFKNLISDYENQDPDFISLIFTLPRISELEGLQKQIDPISLNKELNSFKIQLGKCLNSNLYDLLFKIKKRCFYKWPNGQGERRLKGIVWDWLAASGDEYIRNQMLDAVKNSSMTLKRSALDALKPIDCIERDQSSKIFYEMFKYNPLILDYWFRYEASASRENAIMHIEKLLTHPSYDPLAPNAVRSVLSGLVDNVEVFHNINGKGYEFFTNQITIIDQINPITASRLLKIFSRWKSFKEPNRELIYDNLVLLSQDNLSNNTFEVLSLILSLNN
tara:strand:+ start:2298 stop:4916 length:2619 start_codon:yes stop_codon:yes gene_type:complete